jgi:prevent-host-death family protein
MGTEVGIRELRNNLSRYLARVQSGEEVVVTDHGRAVARVLPLRGAPTLDRLIEAGLVIPARQRKRASSRPLKTAGTGSDLVAQQRR